MPQLSIDAILMELTAVEPNLSRLATAADQSDVQTIESLLTNPDTRTRANAVTLISLIDAASFWRVLPRVLQDPEHLVRLQAARSLENFSDAEIQNHIEMVASLLSDLDAGVRKFAVRTAARVTSAIIRQTLERMAQSDDEPFVRNEAARALRQPK